MIIHPAGVEFFNANSSIQTGWKLSHN